MSLICIPVYSCEWERGEVTASGQEIIILYMVTVAQTIKNLPAVQETWVGSLGWEDPLEESMATTPVFLPGESHGQRSLTGYSAGVA